jgi:hypothetical protein
MMNCKTGYVYKIISNQSNHVYVGSTFNRLSDRLRQHAYGYAAWSSQICNEVNDITTMSIYPYFEQYGVSDFTIVLIKEYIVVDRQHLLAFEQVWINKLECVNKHAAFNPLNRSSKLRQRSCKQRIDDWKTNNKDKINRAQQRYRDKTRDQRNEKITCGCGKNYTYSHKARHQRTKKHQHWLEISS